MIGGGVPFGAEQRLLPEWIPLSFFSFALLCLPLGWAFLILQADVITTFEGGFGPVAATLHTFTIGVILSTAFGASMQMLPVATGGNLKSPTPVIALLVILIAGVIILLGGFAHYLPDITALGTLFLLVASALYSYMLVRLLLRVESLKLVRNHVLSAALCLMLAVLLAIGVIGDWANHIRFDMADSRLLHAGLALYGFMGLVVFGFSRIMVPMLSVSDKSNDKIATLALILALAALLLWVGGFFKYAPAVALIAAGLHLFEMIQILNGRMRKRMGPEWLMIRFSWAMLPISLILALLAQWSDNLANSVQLCILIAVLGWLVSFIIGILQRIIPFLLSMQIARHTGMPELPNKLAAEKLITFVGPLHIAAVAFCAVGIAMDYALFIRIGGLVGIASGLSFLTFLFIAIKRKRLSLEKMKK